MQRKMDLENGDYKVTKEEHHWTTDEKIKFLGYGEWVEEADIREFEYLGCEAIVMRVIKREPYAKEEAYFGGHFCGYVKIPKSHPLFRQRNLDLDCHGGLTCNEIHEEHWVGFDCAHTGDYVPSIEHFRKTNPSIRELAKMLPIPEGLDDCPLFYPVYKNIEFCTQECMNLITQLAVSDAVSKIKKPAPQNNHQK